MIVFLFTKKSEKELFVFDPTIREYLIDGLRKAKDPVILETGSKLVYGLPPATHRLRIGNYRILYELDGDSVTILKIGHRRDVYR